MAAEWLLYFLSSFNYTDEIGRNKFFPLAAAAYSSSPQDCIANKYENAALYNYEAVKCDPLASDSCAGFTAILHNDKAIVLSFRGTNRYLQLVVEADETIFHKKRWEAGGYVSEYFYDAFFSIWNAAMEKDFLSLRQQYPSYSVWVTGHSLGASMASLATSYIILKNYAHGTQVMLVTYGQPRTGDKDYANAHNKQLSFSYRVVHWRDMVPHLPPEDLEGYYHHDSEVFYPYDMSVGSSFTFCHADESVKCSDGLDFDLSIEDHLHYFGKRVSEYGINGCK